MTTLQSLAMASFGAIMLFVAGNWLTNGALVACTWHCVSNGQLPDQVMWETMKALCA